MEALDEYIVMVLFVLLLKRVHFLAFFKIDFDRETWQKTKHFVSTWRQLLHAQLFSQ